jgi:NitT/TauT family transport system ATP-binding protein
MDDTTGPRGPHVSDPNSLLDVRDLNLRYSTRRGEDVSALEHVTLSVKRGEFLTIVGASGCGKSSLLKILGGLIPVTSGTVTFDGIPIEKPRREVGFVFQSTVLLPWRTVLENALLPIEIFKLDRARYTARARELLDLVGLSDFSHRYPNELSGGMQQRAAIVRTLVPDPAVLLMDEPFGALDAMTRETMNVETMRIWAETHKTIVFVTHSIPEAVLLGDRVLVMSPRPGTIAETCTIDLPRPRDLEVMADPKFIDAVARIRSHFNVKRSLD